MTSLLVDVVRREPLAAADGRSGSLLERVVLAGGQELVVKHVRAGGDWIMRATSDGGRAAELWSSGVLARVPQVIDHAVVGAEQVAVGWVVVMRDVASGLVADDARLSRDDSRGCCRAPSTRPARRPGCARAPSTRLARWPGTLPRSGALHRPDAGLTRPGDSLR